MIKNEILNEGKYLTFEDEPKLLDHLKWNFKQKDFEDLSYNSIKADMVANRSRGINTKWAKMEQNYMKADKNSNDPKVAKIYQSKINKCNELDCIKIHNLPDAELGYDFKSKRVYCFDHNYGFMSSSCTISELLSLYK